MNTGTLYELYVNRPQRTVKLHVSTCGQLRKMGGVSGTNPPTGWYVTGLATRRQAEAVAELLARGLDLQYHPRCACL